MHANLTRRLHPPPPPRKSEPAVREKAEAKAQRAYRGAVRRILGGANSPKNLGAARGAVADARRARYGNKRYTPPAPKAQR